MKLQGSLTARLGICLGLLAVAVCAMSAVAFVFAPQGAQWMVLAGGAAALLLGAVPALITLRGMKATLAGALGPARQLVAGDLEAKFNMQAEGELGEMTQAMRSVNERLAKLVADVRTGTTSVAGTSSHISRDNAILKRRAELMGDSLTRTASAMEQFNATVQQNTDHAIEADRLMSSTFNQVRNGGKAMTQVVDTMGSIRESSRKIVDIIGVIDGIAFQTNILALNAAVEAARAGEQGRGFAVVASEVRSLAGRSAEAAKQIKSLIHSSSETVNSGSKLVDDAGKTMSEIMSSVESVAGIVKHISQASLEQRAGIETVNMSITECAQTNQQNASLVAEVIKSADSLNTQAVTLKKSVAAFKGGERENGTVEEARALLQRAVEFAKTQGRAALIAEATKGAQSCLVERDLYVIAMSTEDYTYKVQPINPRAVGLDCRNTKDIHGRTFIHDMVEAGKKQGRGSVEYQWNHPVTNEVKDKLTYFERVGDLVLACGAYKD